MNDIIAANADEAKPLLSEAPVFERDSRGLVKGVKYVFKSNGKVDWRRMVNEEFVIFNPQRIKQIEEKYGKSVDILKTSEVEDRDLMILLGGIKELADLRGILDCDCTPVYVADNNVTVKTRITWMPNFETAGHNVSFTGIGAATLENTNGFGQNYLAAIAENRGFVRSVRGYLGINIVGQDEVGGKGAKFEPEHSPKSAPFSSNAFLETKCQERGITFDVFKATVLAKYSDKVSNDVDIKAWTGFASLKAIDATNFIEVLKEYGLK